MSERRDRERRRDDLVLELLKESRDDIKTISKDVSDLKADLSKTKVKVGLLFSLALIIFSGSVVMTDTSKANKLNEAKEKIIQKMLEAHDG